MTRLHLSRRRAAYRYRRSTGRGRLDCLEYVVRYNPAGPIPKGPFTRAERRAFPQG